MNRDARILVATDSADDANLVRKLLNVEFDNVAASTNPEHSVQDFEKHRPEVLILAFKGLEKAERYYLGLYRLGTLVHVLPHRTLILCGKDDLQRVYELCKKEHFDDYVLFWPMTHDAPRLPMAVHHALRQLACVAAGNMPSVGELAAQARRIAGLEALLEESLAKGTERIDVANRSLSQVRQRISVAMENFTRSLADGSRPDLIEIRDQAGFQTELKRLETEQLDKHLQSIADAVHPVGQWAGALKQDLACKLESVRALQSMAACVRPTVLVVDDEEFQHKLLARLLSDENLELIFAASGTQALATLRKRRPDLVLMDFNLPDIDGVETTRRLKSVETLMSIPIVMITGQSGKHIVVESLKAGAVDFVVKPFDKEILRAKVRKYLM